MSFPLNFLLLLDEGRVWSYVTSLHGTSLKWCNGLFTQKTYGGNFF